MKRLDQMDGVRGQLPNGFEPPEAGAMGELAVDSTRALSPPRGELAGSDAR